MAVRALSDQAIRVGFTLFGEVRNGDMCKHCGAYRSSSVPTSIFSRFIDSATPNSRRKLFQELAPVVCLFGSISLWFVFVTWGYRTGMTVTGAFAGGMYNWWRSSLDRRSIR